MTSLISARRAAEDFARVVDGSQKDVADRYADLTATVDLLRRQDTPAARPDFVADLRAQLMAAADTLLVPVDAEPAEVVTLRPRRHQRRLAAAAAAFVVVGGTAGVAAAAENSLPGDPLYALKRGIESAQVSLNTSDAAKGRDLISQANTRLDEVDGLVAAGDSTSRITHTLASFQRSESGGADLLFVAYQRGGSPDDLATLRGTLLTQRDRLKTLAGQAPSAARPDFASAAALLGDLDQQAKVLCNCGPDTGASDFADLSSSPALQSLITDAAAAAAADQQQSITKSLANKASAIAAKTPQAPATTEQATRDASGSVLPGSVTVPSLPTTQTAPLKSTVTTVTGGVEGLLGTVNDTTGGLLTPVTDTVNNTIDAVTNLLVGP
jgi:hypothetical protein